MTFVPENIVTVLVDNAAIQNLRNRKKKMTYRITWKKVGPHLSGHLHSQAECPYN